MTALNVLGWTIVGGLAGIAVVTAALGLAMHVEARAQARRRAVVARVDAIKRGEY